MTSDQLIRMVKILTRAISGDEMATVSPLPVAGNEQTLVLASPNGIGRLLGRGGKTFEALRRVVNAASWRTGRSFRLALSDPRTAGINMVKSENKRNTVCGKPAGISDS